MKFKEVLICLLCTACVQPVLENDWTKAALRNKVKSIQSLTTHYDNGTNSRNKGPWDTFVLYNGTGHVIEKKAWGLNGRMTYHQEFTYDETAHLIGKKTYKANRKLREELVYRYDELGRMTEDLFYNANGQQVQRTVFAYDDHGNLIEKQLFRLGRLSDRTVYEFSATNQLLSTSTFDGEGALDKKSVQTYRKAGLEMEILMVDGADNELSRGLYQLDEKGQVLERQNFHMGDTLSYKSKVFEYDKNGNEIDQISYVLGKVASRKTRVYDKKNRILEQTILKSKSRFRNKNSYAYDKKGNIIEHLSYQEDGTVLAKLTWKYTYDKHRNWIKKQEFLDGTLQVVILREVFYYK